VSGLFFNRLPRYLTGFAAATLSIYFLFIEFSDKSIAVVSLYFSLICILDTLKSKIPNILNASLTVAGLALFFYNDGWGGVLTSLAGFALGLALLIIPWMMGGMGAGDVKALAALGALLGPSPLIHVFIYMGLIGGLMAIAHYIFERNLLTKGLEWMTALKASVLTNDPKMIIPDKTEVSRFPYAAAIAFGYYAYISFGEFF